MARDSWRNGDDSDEEGKENDELTTLDPATLRATDENCGVTSPLSEGGGETKRSGPGFFLGKLDTFTVTYDARTK